MLTPIYRVSKASARLPVKLILFDAFGTLFHPRLSISQQYIAVAEKHGITGLPHADMLSEVFRQCLAEQQRKQPVYGRQNVDMHDYAYNQSISNNSGNNDGSDNNNSHSSLLDSSAQPWWRQLTFDLQGVFEPVKNAIFDELWHGFSCADNYSLYPDTLPTLKRCIADHFKFVLCSEDLGFEKPDVRTFLAATNAVGVNPTNTLHVGDDYARDFLGAQAAGLMAVLLQREQHKNSLVPKDVIQNRCIKSLGELLPNINSSDINSDINIIDS
ncbi:HAD-like domain-containing protein [Syncephalis fuscata]|nr:HAD-like domain-containing protein [Syncephalis fuscata]